MFKKIKEFIDDHIHLITVIALVIAGLWTLFAFISNSDINEFEIKQKIQAAEKQNFELEKKLQSKQAYLENLIIQIASRDKQISTADRTIKTIKENTTDQILKEQQLNVAFDGRNRLIEAVNKLKNDKADIAEEIESIKFQLRQNHRLITSYSE